MPASVPVLVVVPAAVAPRQGATDDAKDGGDDEHGDHEVEEAADGQAEAEDGEVGAREEGQRAAAVAVAATVHRRRDIRVVGVATSDGADLKEDPPTRPPERAASASSGVTADVSITPARAAAKGMVSSFGRVPTVWSSLCAEQVTGRAMAETLLGRCTGRSGSLVQHSEVVGTMHECAMLSGSLVQACGL